MACAYGAQSPAPGTSVDNAPAAQARRNASSCPVSHPAASTPANTSPAPVVSTASTGGAAKAHRSSRPTQLAPRPPLVISTYGPCETLPHSPAPLETTTPGVL